MWSAPATPSSARKFTYIPYAQPHSPSMSATAPASPRGPPLPLSPWQRHARSSSSVSVARLPRAFYIAPFSLSMDDDPWADAHSPRSTPRPSAEATVREEAIARLSGEGDLGRSLTHSAGSPLSPRTSSDHARTGARAALAPQSSTSPPAASSNLDTDFDDIALDAPAPSTQPDPYANAFAADPFAADPYADPFAPSKATAQRAPSPDPFGEHDDDDAFFSPMPLPGAKEVFGDGEDAPPATVVDEEAAASPGKGVSSPATAGVDSASVNDASPAAEAEDDFATQPADDFAAAEDDDFASPAGDDFAPAGDSGFAAAAGGDDGFGDFDDFDAPAPADFGDDEFGDFGDFGDADAAPMAAPPAPAPAPVPVPVEPRWSTLSLRPVPPRAELLQRITAVLEPVVPDPSDFTSEPPRAVGGLSQVLTSESSRDAYAQLTTAPILKPLDWTRSRVRREHLIAMGVPVNLDEVDSHRLSALPPLRITTADMPVRSQSAQPTPAANKRHSMPPPATAALGASAPASVRNSQADKYDLGPRPPLDTAVAEALCGLDEEQLALLPLARLQALQGELEQTSASASALLAYLVQLKDALATDSRTYNGMISELIANAAKQKAPSSGLFRRSTGPRSRPTSMSATPRRVASPGMFSS